MAVKISTISMSIFLLALLSFSHCCYGQLKIGFYSETCPDLESTVSKVVQKSFNKDSAIAPRMIRLYFHDCFSNGCDASLLLEGRSCEKNATANGSVLGYELIDDVKNALDENCRLQVSCSDIIALATRDLVTLASGGKVRYEIPTGRFDGLVSLSSTVDLPSPDMSVLATAAKFADRKLNITDMVLLLGGHTIGVTHCPFIMDRLYNFQNTQQPDPSMDPNLVQELRRKCPQNPSTNDEVNLDQDFSSSNIVDVSFYKQIGSRRGILQIDQQIAISGLTNKTVTDLANGNDFLVRFGEAMVKLGSVGVKTKANGEVRRSCRICNNPLFCVTG